MLRRILIVCVVVAVAGAIGFVWTLRGSLPRLEGDVSSAKLAAAVDVERDALGVPTITASSRTDLAFATGFVHAQDRFFQMDLSRRRSAGELAALVGAAALPLDRQTRVHRLRARARAVIDGMTDGERSLLAAYVSGVNEGLQDLRARPFEYLLLGTEPEPWRDEDTLLVVYAMFLQLNDERAARDVQRGYAALVLHPAAFAWLYPEGTEWDAPMAGERRTQAVALPTADQLDLRSLRETDSDAAVADAEGRMPGSNNWAVSGAMTASGAAIVANDMHLGISVPGVFYKARLVETGRSARDVTGVMLPGVPIVVAGSNGHVAWGFTNSYGDWSDAVLVRVGQSADTYQTPSGDRPFTDVSEVIHVKDGASETLTIRETIWGPVLADVEFPGGDIAVRWIAHDTDGVNIVQLELETATSVAEALDVANRVAIPPQNFVVGDRAGNVGWTIAGRIPRRGDAAALRPADWSDGAGWAGWLEPSEYPRIVNPESGRIWTANARVVDGAELALIGDGGYDLGARAGQIRQNLFALNGFTTPDMLAIQLDDRALFLERWRSLLLDTVDDAATETSPGRAEFRRLVAEWTPRAVAESVGYRFVREFRLAVRERVFRMLTLPVRARFDEPIGLRISNQFEKPLWQLMTQRPVHLLSADYADWNELLLQTIDEQIDRYQTEFDGTLADRSWGESNRAAIRHPLSRAVPLLSRWLDMPAQPLDGDGNMPRVQRPSFGASERFAVAPGDEANGYLHLPAGQSGHPMSPFYDSGHAEWAAGRPISFLPGSTQHRLRLLPET